MAITALSNSGLAGDKYYNAMTVNNYMEPIATTLVGSGGASSITFSNIPQNYTHLQVRLISRETGTNGYYNVLMRANNDSGANNYYSHILYGNGTSVLASSYASSTGYSYVGLEPGNNQLASSFGGSVIDVLDYTNQNKYKTIRSLSGFTVNGGTGGEAISLCSALWINTSPITSLTFYPAGSGSSFMQYSRFSLYGLRG